MKTILLYALALLIPAAALAQNPAAPRRVRMPSNKSTVKPTPAKPAPQITRNVTLHWKGSLLGSIDIDLELTGCGPTFTVDLPMPHGATIGEAEAGLPKPIVTANATLTKTENGYRVSHTIGARVAVKTSSYSTGKGGAVSTNIEFRDVMLQGEIIIQPGKPVTLSKIEGKELTLTLTELD